MRYLYHFLMTLLYVYNETIFSIKLNYVTSLSQSFINKDNYQMQLCYREKHLYSDHSNNYVASVCGYFVAYARLYN